jgi:hypothetical protein
MAKSVKADCLREKVPRELAGKEAEMMKQRKELSAK